MTDRSAPVPSEQPSSDDEVVSAVLDGEATPAEVARVEADPVLRARVGVLGAVAARVAEPVTVDPTLEDRHLAAARAAWETQTTPAAPGDRATAVTELATRRRRRTTRTFAAAAAIAVLVLVLPVLVAVLTRSTDPGDDETAAARAEPTSTVVAADTGDAAREPAAATAEATPDGGASAADPGVTPTTVPDAAPTDLGDLGAVADPDALRVRVDAALVARASMAAPEASEAPTSTAAVTAPDPPTTTVAPGPPVAAAATDACLDEVTEAGGVAPRATAEATIAGVPRAVYVVDTADGTSQVVVVDPTTCAVVARLPL